MLKSIRKNWSLIAGGVAALAGGLPALAQDDEGYSPDGYQVREDRRQPGATRPVEANDNGPVRLARVAFVQGDVTWRPGQDVAWSAATINLPMREGAQIYTADGARAELQFDDGSFLRLASGTVVTLQRLYSDQDGAFTGIRLSEGLLTLRARHKYSIYQIDTPFLSAKTKGAAKLRVGVRDSVEVALRDGEALVECRSGEAELARGDYVNLRAANDPLDVGKVPGKDSWDRWNDERDQKLDQAAERPSRQYLPPNIATAAPDLDDYGDWQRDPEYGNVWFPRVTVVNWRPYYYGRWVWCAPFGWTWVSAEPWGWAPYHYGTWVFTRGRWGWCPGPATQYWSPAVVHFIETNGSVGWVPLAPQEIVYPPALSIGFRGGNWGFYFAIGQVGCYYPNGFNQCIGRPWRTAYVNNCYNGLRLTDIPIDRLNDLTRPIYAPRSPSDLFRNSREYRLYNRNTYLDGRAFVPRNAQFAPGMTMTRAQDFGGQGSYQALPMNPTEILRGGRHIGAPPAGGLPIAGPVSVHPTLPSLTPSRNFTPGVAPNENLLRRPVYRTRFPDPVVRARPPIRQRSETPPSQRLDDLTRPFDPPRWRDSEIGSGYRRRTDGQVPRLNTDRVPRTNDSSSGQETNGIIRRSRPDMGLGNANGTSARPPFFPDRGIDADNRPNYGRDRRLTPPGIGETSNNGNRGGRGDDSVFRRYRDSQEGRPSLGLPNLDTGRRDRTPRFEGTTPRPDRSVGFGGGAPSNLYGGGGRSGQYGAPSQRSLPGGGLPGGGNGGSFRPQPGNGGGRPSTPLGGGRPSGRSNREDGGRSRF